MVLRAAGAVPLLGEIRDRKKSRIEVRLAGLVFSLSLFLLILPGLCIRLSGERGGKGRGEKASSLSTILLLLLYLSTLFKGERGRREGGRRKKKEGKDFLLPISSFS